MYGVPLAPHDASHEAVCAGCLGSKNEELAKEPMVLCDGKKCGREYHLSCCLPSLEPNQIPEGPYLCVDCDPDGSSSQLERYFEDIADARSDFGTSREYVESLLRGHRIPVSEVQRVSELHRDAIAATVNPTLAASSSQNTPPVGTDATANVHPMLLKASSSSHDTQVVGADFFIGKPLRLYCPEGNSYHDGRIIDWRRATHLRPITSSPPQYDLDFLFGSMSEIARSEFLVSFSAGLNYRKRTVHQWIVLEEHALAVGTSLIWCLPPKKKVWSPGITWLRTALELIPVLDILSEPEGEVRYYVDSKFGHHGKTWSLAQIFGDDRHQVLLLREQSADFFSPGFSERFQKRNDDDGGIDIPLMLAYTEAEEQRRIRRWSKLPLQNPAHERALTIADEYMLPQLELRPPDSSSKEKSAVSLGPRPCPLIRQGLDRMWIMEQIKGATSKDMAASLSCQRVKSRTEAIRQLQEQGRVGTSAS